MEVVEEMLACLKQRGLNQTWLAEKMGVSRSYISRILDAAPNMTLLTITKIAVGLGTTPAVFLDSKSRQPGAVQHEPAYLAETADTEYGAGKSRQRIKPRSSPRRRRGRREGSDQAGTSK
ncbi:MAG: helix-turn-helix transcriptional regulator [Chloroflexi bacterium]|nr:helix-turn-helix transcriptional regulator [Chloroflexota bacterium]